MSEITGVKLEKIGWRPAYLADNQLVVDGIEIPEDVAKVAVDSRREFTSLGQVWCESLNCMIPIGIKKRGQNSFPDLQENSLHDRFRIRAAEELAVISTLAENARELYPRLPVFYALTVDSEGDQIGIMTEDFSSGATLSADPDSKDKLTSVARGALEKDFGGVYTWALFRRAVEQFGRVNRFVDLEDILSDRDPRTVEIVQSLAVAMNAGEHLVRLPISR